MADNSSSALAVLLILAAGYLLPTIIAAVRFRTNTLAIFAMNLLLGWLLIGWIIALIWALSSDKPSTVVVNNNAGNGGGSSTPLTRWNSKECPMCAERILKAAKKCRYCGHLLEEPAKAA